MNNLQRRPEQEPDALLYDPKCAVQFPEAIRSWAINLGINPNDCRKLMDGFLILIPFYHANEDGTFPSSPEYWQRNLLSYSFYLGLEIIIFKRDIAFYLLYGATEGCSREVLFWLNEIKNSGCQDKVQQWHYAINVLSVFTEGYSQSRSNIRLASVRLLLFSPWLSFVSQEYCFDRIILLQVGEI